MRRLLAIAILLAASAPLGALANDTREAVAIAREAKEAYDRGDWAVALERFVAAEARAHSPVLVLYAARCHRNLGQLLAARDLYRRAATDDLAENAPEPFRAAKRDAARELAELEPRIPTVVIDRSRAPSTWTMTLDGEPVDGAAPIPIDPGDHLVVARDGAEETFRQRLSAEEGAALRVTVRADTLAPDPDARDGGAASGDAPASVGGDAMAWVPGAVLLGVGLAGIGVGVGTRVAAFQKVADVESRCVDGLCAPEDEAEIDRAVTLQTASTVAFAVGGAVAAAGIVLLVVLPARDDDLALRLGPGFVGVVGAF